jgi:hypothetical protein
LSGATNKNTFDASTQLRSLGCPTQRLARKAKVIGRRRLKAPITVVAPDTLLRWFRVLIARKWTQQKIGQ